MTAQENVTGATLQPNSSASALPALVAPTFDFSQTLSPVPANGFQVRRLLFGTTLATSVFTAVPLVVGTGTRSLLLVVDDPVFTTASVNIMIYNTASAIPQAPLGSVGRQGPLAAQPLTAWQFMCQAPSAGPYAATAITIQTEGATLGTQVAPGVAFGATLYLW